LPAGYLLSQLLSAAIHLQCVSQNPEHALNAVRMLCSPLAGDVHSREWAKGAQHEGEDARQRVLLVRYSATPKPLLYNTETSFYNTETLTLTPKPLLYYL
jgi:hypothetical protein